MPGYPSDFYNAISAKRGLINRIAYLRQGLAGELESYRNPIEGPVKPPVQAATDGGLGVKRLAGFTVYMVRGYSVAYRDNSGENSLVGEEIYADIGILIPPSREETRISLYRDAAELWTGYKLLRKLGNGGVYLGDGSVVSLIVEPSIVRMGRREKDNHPIKCILGKIDPEELKEETIKTPLAARRLLGIDEESAAERQDMMDKGEEDLGNCALYLEYIEKTLLLRMLLEEAWKKSITPIFISKSSRTSFLYGNKLYSDTYLIQLRDPQEPGYFYNPSRVRGSGGVEGHLWSLLERGIISSLDLFKGNILGLAEFYENLSVVRFYTRLQRDAPILRVEVPLPASEFQYMDPGELKEAIGTIVSSVSRELAGLELADGYPLILKLVHERSKISGKEAEILFNALGLQAEHGSREVLGE